MAKNFEDIKRIILPNKKINLLAIFILFLGVIMGAIFAGMISPNDKTIVIDKIKLFIDNINGGEINSFVSLKNSLTINLLYVLIIWMSGMALIGIIINLIILFIKGFIFSFSIASFILAYKYKGLILASLYLIFGEFLSIILVLILTIYSIMFSFKLIKLIFAGVGNNNIKHFLKNYGIILVLGVIMAIISSLSEAFLLPALIKLIIKLYI